MTPEMKQEIIDYLNDIPEFAQLPGHYRESIISFFLREREDCLMVELCEVSDILSGGTKFEFFTDIEGLKSCPGPRVLARKNNLKSGHDYDQWVESIDAATDEDTLTALLMHLEDQDDTPEEWYLVVH